MSSVNLSSAVGNNIMRATIAVVFAAVASSAALTHAQSYPSKPVRVIVPFPSGSGADLVARLFTPRLAEMGGQQYVVDNRGGAAGNIGAEAAARATPDGYTLLTVPASVASGQSMYKNLPFDLSRDFDPIAMMALLPYMLVSTPALPATSVRELIALAKAKPGELNYASSGNGGAGHLTSELFNKMAGVKIVHVPYKGAAAGFPDLMAGRVSMMFTGIAIVMPHVNAGRMRALGVASASRSQIAPQYPTIAESGLPGFEATTWFALAAPAGTPRNFILQLNAQVIKIAQSADMRERLLTQGAEPQPGTPEQLRAFIKNEVVKWADVVAASGARPE